MANSDTCLKPGLDQICYGCLPEAGIEKHTGYAGWMYSVKFPCENTQARELSVIQIPV